MRRHGSPTQSPFRNHPFAFLPQNNVLTFTHTYTCTCTFITALLLRAPPCASHVGAREGADHAERGDRPGNAPHKHGEDGYCLEKAARICLKSTSLCNHSTSAHPHAQVRQRILASSTGRLRRLAECVDQRPALHRTRGAFAAHGLREDEVQI